jgi:hypothetical protein
MRETMGVVVLGVLLVTAGCSDVSYVGVTPSVSVERTGGDYSVTIGVQPTSDTEYTYRDLRVVGLGPDGEPVCTARFGDTAPGDDRRTETVTCDRLPLVFRAESAGRDTPTADVVVEHETLALVAASPGRYEYEPLEGPVEGTAVGTAKCVLRRDGADPAAFAGPTPWLDWPRLPPETRTVSELRSDNQTGWDTYADVGETTVDLSPTAVPDDPAVEPLERSLAAAAEQDSTPEDVMDDRTAVELSRDRLLTVLAAFYDREFGSLDEVPTANLTAATTTTPTDRQPAFAAAVRYDTRSVTCDDGATGRYVGARGVTVTLAVSQGERTFLVEATGLRRWSGPAFNTTAA